MKTHIALLRGINVGGKNSLPMKGLVALFEEFGARNVRTYVHSGNVVFESAEEDLPRFAGKVTAAISERYGFEPRILILGTGEIEKAVRENPFPEAEANPTFLHVGFLASVPPNPDMDRLAGLKKESERFQLTGSVFYLYSPEGVGRSKLAANTEKLLGVPMTDRNWKTVCKLRDMVS